MSIIGNVFKVAGTIVEGCGKTIKDCVEVVEHEAREYRASEQYIKDKEQRDVYIREIKGNWQRIKHNTKELVKTYSNNEESKNI